jgi:AcrR family transcriptional regulator
MKTQHEKTACESTRERILEASLKLISEKGYLGTSTREIARESGIAELTIFRHFGSKEKLLEEVIARYTFLPTLKGLLPSLAGLEFRESLFVIGERFIETLQERKSLVRIMLSEITVYPEKIRSIYRDFIDGMVGTLAEYFRTLQEKGTFKESISCEVAARFFLGSIHSYFQAEEIIKDRSLKKKDTRNFIFGLVEIFTGGCLRQAHKKTNSEENG